MIWLYYFGFACLLGVAGPILLCQKKSRAGLSQKLGMVSSCVRTAKLNKPIRIWFHAVSVGEFTAILPVLNRLRQERPDVGIFVSTTTATGQKLAQDKVGQWACVFYFPFDLPWALKTWLDAIAPRLAVIAETEIWPGFTYECQRRAIPLCCINGRISPRSFRGYKRFGWFFRAVLSKFSALGVQTEEEAKRYIELGANPPEVHVTGNLKFEGIEPISTSQKDKLRLDLNLEQQDFTVIGGSTHEGEEALLLNTLKRLKQVCAGKTIRLILAPRHPERFDRVCQIVETHGFKACRHSRTEAFQGTEDVYVLDTIGQLNMYYAVADLAFVGGTIAPIGGHSLIEPYAYGVPVVCGPHTEKTRDIARHLLSRNAMRQATDAASLSEQILQLAQDPEQRESLGRRGQLYLLESQGALERTMAILYELLDLPNQGRQSKELAGDGALTESQLITGSKESSATPLSTTLPGTASRKESKR